MSRCTRATAADRVARAEGNENGDAQGNGDAQAVDRPEPALRKEAPEHRAKRPLLPRLDEEAGESMMQEDAPPKRLHQQHKEDPDWSQYNKVLTNSKTPHRTHRTASASLPRAASPLQRIEYSDTLHPYFPLPAQALILLAYLGVAL